METRRNCETYKHARRKRGQAKRNLEEGVFVCSLVTCLANLANSPGGLFSRQPDWLACCWVALLGIQRLVRRGRSADLSLRSVTVSHERKHNTPPPPPLRAILPTAFLSTIGRECKRRQMSRWGKKTRRGLSKAGHPSRRVCASREFG